MRLIYTTHDNNIKGSFSFLCIQLAASFATLASRLAPAILFI